MTYKERTKQTCSPPHNEAMNNLIVIMSHEDVLIEFFCLILMLYLLTHKIVSHQAKNGFNLSIYSIKVVYNI